MAIWRIVVWTLWLECNDTIFNNIKGSTCKLLQKVWLGLIDYVHLAWEAIKTNDKYKIMNVWYKNGIFVEMVMGHPRWKFTDHSNGFDIH
jgi:hypothetical protein